MVNINPIDEFFTVVQQEGLYPSPGNMRFYLSYLFKDISFTGKSMLDIGGGAGLYSFYAGCCGAKRVVCLEPEVEGSSQGMQKQFHKLTTLLGMDQVTLHSIKFQDYNPGSGKFDVILLHNSVNHLDETACINLQHDNQAVETYKRIFQKLSICANNGAKLVITDCSRYNFFPLLHIKNPLPYGATIAWHKHQSPDFWVRLLCDSGFHNPKIRWTSFNSLRTVGRLLLGNRIAAYFLQSHFCLTMIK